MIDKVRTLFLSTAFCVGLTVLVASTGLGEAASAWTPAGKLPYVVETYLGFLWLATSALVLLLPGSALGSPWWLVAGAAAGQGSGVIAFLVGTAAFRWPELMNALDLVGPLESVFSLGVAAFYSSVRSFAVLPGVAIFALLFVTSRAAGRGARVTQRK